MMNAADLTHNSGVDEWDTEADVTCCTFGAPAAGNKGKGLSDKKVTRTNVTLKHSPSTSIIR